MFNRLENTEICKKYLIPIKLNNQQKFNYLRYQILEFWDRKKSYNACQDIFGLYKARDMLIDILQIK